jgi:hypothetical protein
MYVEATMKGWKVKPGPGVDQDFTRYIRWYPKVDKLTVLEIPGICELAQFAHSTVALNVTSGDQNWGTKEHIYRYDAAYVTEFLATLVFLEKGRITGFQWDSNFDTASCFRREPRIDYSCPSEYKVSGNCSNETRKFKIFIAFVGSDSKKIPLSSAQLMPSTFVKFGVGGIVDSVKDLVNKF